MIAATAAEGLAHEAPDVQKATLKLLEKITPPSDAKVRSIVESLQPTLAASVRSSASKWLEKDAPHDESQGLKSPSPAKTAAKPKQSASATSRIAARLSPHLESVYAIDQLREHLQHGRASIPAACFDGTDIPRLVGIARIEPIESVEELIDVCARVVEDGALIDDAERCIDGLARLVASKPPNFDQLSGPLMKRTRKLIAKGCSPFCGLDPANDVLGLFYAFCTGTVIEPKAKGSGLRLQFEGEDYDELSVNTKKPIGFLSARCLAVAKRIAKADSQQLLSTPTHAGGWIEPRALAARVNSAAGEPDKQDVILAMLRMAPDGRNEAFKALKKDSREWYQAIRYALGADDVRVGADAALWVAAARARSPWTSDEHVTKKHAGLGPDASEVARFAFKSKVRKSGGFTFCDASFATEPVAPKSPDPMLVTVTMHSSAAVGREYSFEMGGFAGRTTGAVRWTASIWPQARESYFASSAAHCFFNLDWSEAEWQNRNMLEPMIDSGTPLRYAGLLLLTSMLAAKEPGESGLATDIAIRAIQDGRLGSDNLGSAMAVLLPSGLIKPGRWHKTLGEIARASSVHAAVVQLALQHCFEKPAKDLPKDFAKLLELLYELSLEIGLPVTNERCREWLVSGGVAGKAMKIAKSLLAIESNAASQEVLRGLLEQALELRIKAASARATD